MLNHPYQHPSHCNSYQLYYGRHRSRVSIDKNSDNAEASKSFHVAEQRRKQSSRSPQERKAPRVVLVSKADAPRPPLPALAPIPLLHDACDGNRNDDCHC